MKKAEPTQNRPVIEGEDISLGSIIRNELASNCQLGAQNDGVGKPSALAEFLRELLMPEESDDEPSAIVFDAGRRLLRGSQLWRERERERR